MSARQAAVVVLFVLALRLPFLYQAIQGDDIYYLYGAQHAQIEPLHPKRTAYAFQGDVVSMQGHPHPPGNAWYLGALLALAGDVSEPVFHAAYLPFSLIAALAALSIAARYTSRPLLATLLFAATPAFVINGTSLESDLPLLAFWLLAIALALAGRMVAAAFALAAAAMCGYQSIVLVPILYVLLGRPHWVMAVVPALLGAHEIGERLTVGAMPAQVLTGYFAAYDLHRLENKIRNAAALAVHLAWIPFPAAALVAFRREWAWGILPALAAAWVDPHPLCWGSVYVGVLILAGARRRGPLGWWILLFFGAALAMFFAGSARYLLPLALPVCILVAEHTGYWAVAASAVLSLALAAGNAAHWDGYRKAAAAVPMEGRVWVNGEWGLRFYLESAGALPLLRGQAVQPGETVVSSRLADSIRYTTGGGVAVPVSRTEILSPVPMQLIGLEAKSAYSSAAKGLRPFDITRAPLDVVETAVVVARKPERSYLEMGDPAASAQIVSGVHELENNAWRWTDGRAVLLLKRPEKAAPLRVNLYLPPEAPGRRVRVEIDGKEWVDRTLPETGGHTLETPPVVAAAEDVRVVISIDKTFRPAGDNRTLGFILSAVGFAATSGE